MNPSSIKLKKLAVYVTLMLTLAACNNDRKSSSEPAPLYPQPQEIPLNTEEGYAVNQMTGDSILPLIGDPTDSIQTGVSIPANGKTVKVDPENLPLPSAILEPALIFDAHQNEHKIPTQEIVFPLDERSLPKIKLGDGNPTLLTTEKGDTLPTGIPIPATGVTVRASQPQPTEAMLPAIKDNAIYDLQYLDVDEGMASSYIMAIIEDSRGNIWFGTNSGGVTRYDGKSFAHFTEKHGLSNNIVWSMLEDRHGNIWFGTRGGGVCRFDGDTFTQFKQTEGLSGNIVLSMFEDSKGNIWISTVGGGVSRYDLTSLPNGQASFTHFTEREGLSNNTVRSIMEDKEGNMWFGTKGGGANKYDGESFIHFTKKQGLAHNVVLSMLEDNENNIWFGTKGGGLTKYDGKTIANFTTKEGLSNNVIFSMLEDSQGNIWFGTEGGGINRFDGKSFTHFTEELGLSNNSVRSILEDSQGNLWFGTRGGGVNRFDPESFTHFTQKQGLSNRLVMSILEDSKENLWFGTWGGGLNKYDGENFTHFGLNQGLSNDEIRSMVEDNTGNLWFGTAGGGLNKFDGENFTNYSTEHGLSNNTVVSLLQDSNGNLWIGTVGGGLSRLNLTDTSKMLRFTHFTTANGLSNNVISSILEDSQGSLWFGTLGGGVSKFDSASGGFTHYTEKEGLSNNFILTIHEDSRGNIWLGTKGGGVNCFDGKSFTYFTEREGLSNNIVFSIQEDVNNSIWVGTESGLDQFIFEDSNGEQLQRVIINSHNKQDGLKGVDFFVNSVYLDNENHIWWGSGKSLSKLDINKSTLSNKPPSVQLNWVEINDEFVDYRNLSDEVKDEIRFDSVKNFYNYPIKLELPHNRNHLTFHFSAINWSAPHKTKYSYLLDGLNTNWSRATKETKADYRNIHYGTYTFKVRAIGESGEWSEPFEYEFTIHPPWWQTWWARTTYCLAAILFIIGFVRWRTSKLEERQKELETEVDIATTGLRKKNIEIGQQHQLLEESHKEITDSIAYAKRIQDATLPSNKHIKNLLPESFVFYQPKDFVSGDFYFVEAANTTSSDPTSLVVFSAADCTGHGVPGAFMSIVGTNYLMQGITEPSVNGCAEALDFLNQGVSKTLRLKKEDNAIRDGMDISICAWDRERNMLHFAGAKNPIYIIRKIEKADKTDTKFLDGKILQDEELPIYLKEIKGDKHPIGSYIYEDLKKFTDHSLPVKKGDMIYLFSDGFADQFGGEKGKKYNYKRYKKILLSISQKPPNEQKEILAKEFKEWKGSLEQIDDVCILGVRI